jgi:hypothetical protein
MYRAMTSYQKRGISRNCHLDPLDWYRERDRRGANRAARKLAQRFGISVHHAAVLVSAAGLGGLSQ